MRLRHIYTDRDIELERVVRSIADRARAVRLTWAQRRQAREYGVSGDADAMVFWSDDGTYEMQMALQIDEIAVLSEHPAAWVLCDEAGLVLADDAVSVACRYPYRRGPLSHRVIDDVLAAYATPVQA